MKKNLFFSILLMLTGLVACQKEQQVQKNAVSTKTTAQKSKVFVNQPTYYYVDLVLQPRQPGQNYDTYAANYGFAQILVTGSPSWNFNSYPNLVNGVPTVGGGISAANGYNAFVAIGTPAATDAEIFTVTVGTLSGVNLQAFQTDLTNLRSAYNIYTDNPNVVKKPKTEDYIKASYSTQAGIINTSGKLIRVTTGSHWAIATADYPEPLSIPSTPLSIVGGVQDPNDATLYYVLYGTNNQIYSVKLVKNGIDTGITGATATGTYTHANGTFIFHVTAVMNRPDGTTFSFTGDLDIS